MTGSTGILEPLDVNTGDFPSKNLLQSSPTAASPALGCDKVSEKFTDSRASVSIIAERLNGEKEKSHTVLRESEPEKIVIEKDTGKEKMTEMEIEIEKEVENTGLTKTPTFQMSPSSSSPAVDSGGSDKTKEVEANLIDENRSNITDTTTKLKDTKGVEEENEKEEEEKLSRWRQGLQTGEWLDVYDNEWDAWYVGQIVKRVKQTMEESKKEEQELVEIQFHKFSKKYNKFYLLSENYLMPLNTQDNNAGGTFVPPLRKSKEEREGERLKREKIMKERFQKQMEEQNNNGEIVKVEKVSRSGRKVTTGVVKTQKRKSLDRDGTDGTTKKGNGGSSSSPENEKGNEANETKSKKRRQSSSSTFSKKQQQQDDFYDWVCTMCNCLETKIGASAGYDEIGDPLLVCGGNCLRAFHCSCVDIDPVEALREGSEDYICESCKTKEHQCFICQESGKVDVIGGVFKCKLDSCGKYYHEDCVANLPATVVHKKVNENDNEKKNVEKNSFVIDKVIVDDVDDVCSGEESKGDHNCDSNSSGYYSFSFTCPRHKCDTCQMGANKEGRGQLRTCLYCPMAFHQNCILPGSRYHTYGLICPAHPDVELPPLHPPPSTPSVTSSQEELNSITATIREDDRKGEAQGGGEGEAEEKNNSPLVVSQSTNHNHFLNIYTAPLPRPKKASEVKKNTYMYHFRAIRSYFDEVHKHPPSFGNISLSRYLVRPTVHEPTGKCQCTDICSPESCMNSLLRIECVPHVEGKARSKNEYANCPAKCCKNRLFSNKKYVKHQVFKEGGMGWGLKTLEPLKKGDLTFEYVGDCIDDQIMEERLEKHRKDKPDDLNMYIMELENGIYLDARERGNNSRFINHSCDPNCELQKWNVGGTTRIGIFAIQDIPAGTPLSYDYQFNTNQKSKFLCYCGAKNCRGTMAPQNMSNQEEGKRKKITKKLVKEVHKREIKRLQDRIENFKKRSKVRRFLTSEYLPGTREGQKVEVKGGPPKQGKYVAQVGRIFLWRNVAKMNQVGFKVRSQLLKAKKEYVRWKKQNHHHLASISSMTLTTSTPSFQENNTSISNIESSIRSNYKNRKNSSSSTNNDNKSSNNNIDNSSIDQLLEKKYKEENEAADSTNMVIEESN